MRRSHRLVVGMLAAGLFVNGCYGSFQLVRKVHTWNGEVSDNKWVVEAVFLVCSWLPVYGVASLADALIFNSVEFWTGSNPLVTADAGTTSSQRIVRHDGEAVLKRISGPSGEQLVIEQSVRGQPGPSLHIQRRGETTVAMDGTGALLFEARTLPDGQVVITDASGRQVNAYSQEQVKRLLQVARQ